MGMVQQPVHGSGGQGLGHQFVEAGRVDVGANGHTAALVGGVDQAEEALGSLSADREQPNVINHDQVIALFVIANMRCTALTAESSARLRCTIAPSDSMENQATRRPASTAACPNASKK